MYLYCTGRVTVRNFRYYLSCDSFSSVITCESRTMYKYELVFFPFQLLIKYGIKELLFVADGIVNKGQTGFNVAPFYDGKIIWNFVVYIRTELIQINDH